MRFQLNIEKTVCGIVFQQKDDDDNIFALEYSLNEVSQNEEDISIWEDQLQAQQEKRAALNGTLEQISDGRCSPVVSTLNSHWEDVSQRQQSYYLKKLQDIIKTFLFVLAPGQEGMVWKEFQERKYCSLYQPELPVQPKKWETRLINEFVEAYNQAETSQTRLQILSIFSGSFSKNELAQILPGVTKWKIDQARLHAAVNGRGSPIISRPIHRTRLDPVKTDHFLDFISRPCLLQDVAYGTRKLKLDSGEQVMIPNAIRTAIPSRIVKQYLAFCSESGFKPVGERTLFRILEVCQASQQKSLQGLDYVSTEGSEAFDVLEEAVETLEQNGVDGLWTKEMKANLKNGKRYLKNDYQTHIGSEETCPDHCICFSLSDQSQPSFSSPCNHDHDVECDSCLNLSYTLEQIIEKISESDTNLSDIQKQNIEFEVKHAVERVNAWKAHLLRTINQERAKHEVLSILDRESAMVVLDWAMKFLPLKFREQMTDFFGKRGRSWHITCVIEKNEDGKMEVESLVHVFNNCVQDWYAVASICENVLHTIKEERPLIKKVYLKSDNAGCYHNGALLVSLRDIGVRVGINIERYDFSETQSGKGICDRKIASMKSHIRIYVNEKHDVVTAEEFKAALESSGGVKGCRAAVAELNTSKETGGVKWDGISFYSSFRYEEKGIRAWRAYGVGEGRLFAYEDLATNEQGETCLRVIQPFPPGTTLGFASYKCKASGQNLFACEEAGCVKVFASEAEVQRHMDTEEHLRIAECESTYDRIRTKWAERVTGVSSIVVPPTGAISNKSQAESLKSLSPSHHLCAGWALKKKAKVVRMTPEVRNYLVEKFNSGSVTGLKADPNQVIHILQ